MIWRIARLMARAKELDAAVREEGARPLPNSLRLAELKRQKLATRDELAMLEAGMLTRA